MALFKDQGYDRTTVEQIQAAAEVSPSTFGDPQQVVTITEFSPDSITEIPHP